MATVKNAIIVGRHTPELGSESDNVVIVGNENILFPTDPAGTNRALYDLFSKARQAEAVILFQNFPAIVAIALMKMAIAGEHFPQIGAIISVPGPREAGVAKQFTFDQNDNAEVANQAVQFANQRASASVSDNILTVIVDPVGKFLFDHIEWLY